MTKDEIEKAKERYPKTDFGEPEPEEDTTPDPALVARYPTQFTAEQREAARKTLKGDRQ